MFRVARGIIHRGIRTYFKKCDLETTVPRILGTDDQITIKYVDKWLDGKIDFDHLPPEWKHRIINEMLTKWKFNPNLSLPSSIKDYIIYEYSYKA